MVAATLQVTVAVMMQAVTGRPQEDLHPLLSSNNHGRLRKHRPEDFSSFLKASTDLGSRLRLPD